MGSGDYLIILADGDLFNVLNTVDDDDNIYNNEDRTLSNGYSWK